MMHGHEKSGSVIVAWKPANKVLRPAVEQSVAEPATAEPVEPRAHRPELSKTAVAEIVRKQLCVNRTAKHIARYITHP